MPPGRPIAVVDAQRCTGCGWCVSACPFQLLSLEVKQWKKTSVLSDPDACPGCRLCLPRCPFGALSMQPRPDAPPPPPVSPDADGEDLP
jgi:NAD-dependent dihydropyrimidine dehydrogenase PreA subunit